ncbi:Lrp/AsnC family transcriptional regulator [Candidatus Woesearchaeota archaeon]|nr:Lrp/AsnC family transcriptional regulator [Candidatus Woesearchaeota archaeon]
MQLDSKDLAIITELKQNSRASVRDIAKKTALRPSTVHNRIQQLRKNNIIEKFTLKLNNKAVGENFIVFMTVKAAKDIPSTVFRNKHIKEVFGITGDYDILLKLKFKDIEEFNNFIIKFRKDNELTNTQTSVVTAAIKEEL